MIKDIKVCPLTLASEAGPYCQWVNCYIAMGVIGSIFLGKELRMVESGLFWATIRAVSDLTLRQHGSHHCAVHVCVCMHV